MKFTVLYVATGLITASTALFAAEWIGLEDNNPLLLGIELAQSGSDDSSESVYVGLPLGSHAGFIGRYAQTQLADGDNRFDSLSLDSTLWFELGELLQMELEHQFEGNLDELEQESFVVGLVYLIEDWQLQLHYTSGELVVFTREEIFNLFTTIPDRFNSDLEGWKISIGQQRQDWYWQVSHAQYDYEPDIAALGSSPFRGFIVKQSALAQTTLLVADSSSLLVGYSRSNNDYAVILSRDRSAIDNSHDDAVLLSFNHWSNDDIGYLLGVSLPVETSSFGLSLGLQWTL